jgi:FKBP-type peptidyl-prolyl cis-trans isomerase
VHYAGRLLDGTEFDSSIKRGVPTQFGVTQVIAGWTEGLQLMTEGSKWELYIPSDLAYGPGGTGPTGPIGPNATLIFEVELLQANVPDEN